MTGFEQNLQKATENPNNLNETKEVKFQVLEKLSRSVSEEQVIDLVSCLEKVLVNAEMIGFGQNAEVFKMDMPYQSVCAKVFKKNRTIVNTVREEFEFQAKVNDLGIKTPKNLLRVRNLDTRQEYVLMERIEGYSLAVLLDSKDETISQVKKSVDQVFFDKLDSMIDTMHEKKIHHRDLHPGNVMINTITNEPVIIDFGNATEAWTDDEDEIYRPVSRMMDPNDGKLKDTITKHRVDKEEIAKMKEKFLKS